MSQNVFSLIRVSTLEQSRGDKAGVARQYRDIDETVKRYGLNVAETFEVIDVSGTQVRQHPKFIRMFEGLKRPDISGIVISEMSRLHRPQGFDDYEVLSHFEKNRKMIWTSEGAVDPTSEGGRLRLLVQGFMAGEEARNIKRRTMQGKLDRRLKGGHAGGTTCLPKGALFVRDYAPNSRTVISWHWEYEPLEAARILKAYELLFQGWSAGRIASEVWGSRKRGSNLIPVLRNPIWYGVRSYRTEAGGEPYHPNSTDPVRREKFIRRQVLRQTPLEIDLRVERDGKPGLVPLISEEMWRRAQEILDQRTGKWTVPRRQNNKQPFLLGGVVRCECGHRLYPVRGRGAQYETYCCATLRRPGDLKPCGAGHVARRDLDTAMLGVLAHELSDVRFLARVQRARLNEKPADKRAEVSIRKQLEELAAQRKQLIIMRSREKITWAEFDSSASELEQQRLALEKLQPAPAEREDMGRYLQMVANAFASIGTMSAADQREVVQAALGQVVVTRAREILSLTILGGWLGTLERSVKLDDHSSTAIR
jgi:DNA invertase Pin-like site-specific DNA recombinase